MLEPRDHEFYQAHLDRVSRSFAFCIGQLPEPFRAWVSLSYLLCRVLDTVEDASWADSGAQERAFKAFDQALEGDLEARQKLVTLCRDVQVTPAERDLMTASPDLFADLQAAPEAVRSTMHELIGTMSVGMQHFNRSRAGGRLVLHTLAEVNQYCFFVAGIVGELLAKLLALVKGSGFQISQAALLRAHHFGIFLQKVNLLKDQVGDQQQGRDLIPSRTLVERSAEENARHAFAFLEALPIEQVEFRRFCAWSLFLGLESLVVARESVRQYQVLKVARGRAEQIIADVEEALQTSSPQVLRELFQRATAKLGWPTVPSPVSTGYLVPEWFGNLYRGLLNPQSLAALGIG